MITWMKNRVLLSISLIFCQFEPGVAYKNVTYKKKVCTSFLVIHSFSTQKVKRKHYKKILVFCSACMNFLIKTDNLNNNLSNKETLISQLMW